METHSTLPVELIPVGVSTDIAVFRLHREQSDSYRRNEANILKILLIRRGIRPYLGMWALPGGFLRLNEELHHCAMREVSEETGIAPGVLIPIGVFDKPDRDPRGRVISHAFTAVLNDEPDLPTGGADADHADWFDIDLVRSLNGRWVLTLTNGRDRLSAELIANRMRDNTYAFDRVSGEGLAFDHAEIIASALTKLRRMAQHPEALLELLPETFTLSALQNVQETITGNTTGAANFRRKIADYVAETDQYLTGVGHRPARLYTRKKDLEE